MTHIKALNPSTKQKQKTTPYFLKEAHYAEEIVLRAVESSIEGGLTGRKRAIRLLQRHLCPHQGGPALGSCSECAPNACAVKQTDDVIATAKQLESINLTS